jgi:hypothetical protein
VHAIDDLRLLRSPTSLVVNYFSLHTIQTEVYLVRVPRSASSPAGMSFQPPFLGYLLLLLDPSRMRVCLLYLFELIHFFHSLGTPLVTSTQKLPGAMPWQLGQLFRWCVVLAILGGHRLAYCLSPPVLEPAISPSAGPLVQPSASPPAPINASTASSAINVTVCAATVEPFVSQLMLVSMCSTSFWPGLHCLNPPRLCM